MNERSFRQLCENIERDGCLTSAVLVVEDADRLVVLSGNHRVKASLSVGLSEIPYIRIKSDINEARKVAIQLSHNAITGEDDLNLLRELYDSLDLLEKQYSGLTDDDIGVLSDPELAALAVQLPKHQELGIAFLPEGLEELEANIERFKKIADKGAFWAAKLEDYKDFYSSFVKFKLERKIGNEGVALVEMAKVAVATLEAKAQSNED